MNNLFVSECFTFEIFAYCSVETHLSLSWNPYITRRKLAKSKGEVAWTKARDKLETVSMDTSSLAEGKEKGRP